MDLTAAREENYNATISGIQEITEDLRLFQVTPDEPITGFEPGQYSTLGLLAGEPGIIECRYQDDKQNSTKLLRRAYSISHPILRSDLKELVTQNELKSLEFYIALVRKQPHAKEAPLLTPRLFNLAVKDRLTLGKITGRYVLNAEEASSKMHLVFCATGTGEAPHNTMIWKLLSDGFKGRITAVVSVRRWADLAYKKTYEVLSSMHKNFTYLCLPTREPDVKKRYIQEIIERGEFEKMIGETLSPKTHRFYLCGNPSMIGGPRLEESKLMFPEGQKGVIEVLHEKGFVPEMPRQEGHVHYEKYW